MHPGLLRQVVDNPIFVYVIAGISYVAGLIRARANLRSYLWFIAIKVGVTVLAVIVDNVLVWMLKHKLPAFSLGINELLAVMGLGLLGELWWTDGVRLQDTTFRNRGVRHLVDMADLAALRRRVGSQALSIVGIPVCAEDEVKHFKLMRATGTG